MQRIFLVTVLVLAVVVTSVSCKSSKHSKSKRLPGVWQAQPITVDGNSKDWPNPYPEYDDKAYIGYAVSNDKENLYITVETGDPATQLKILREGLTVWIDKTGGKEEQTAINYPIPISNVAKEEHKRQAGQGQQGMGGNSDDKRRQELEDKVDKALAEANEYSLQGFKSCNLQYPIMVMDSCGIKTRIAMDTMDRELVWEAVVPFKSFYYKAQIARSDKGKPMTIIIETTGAKRPAAQSSGGGSHGGGGMQPSFGMGGMGMGMGMRMGGGGMHNRGSQNNNNNSMMEPLYKSTKTYKKFGIAYQE